MSHHYAECQIHQTPFTRSCCQATERELAGAQDFLDDANNRCDGIFAQAIDGFADLCLKLIGHLHHSTGIVSRRFWLLCEILAPTAMMRVTPGGNIRLNAAGLYVSNIVLTEVAIIQCSCVGEFLTLEG